MKNRVKIPKLLFFQEGPGVRNYQYTTEGVKLLNVANLVNGNLDLSTSERYISEEEAYGKYKHFLCDEGDLIIASSGIKVDYFDKKMGFVKPEHLPLCMNTSTIRFKSLDREVLDINYFMYFLKSQAFKKQLARQITGSAQLNFGPSHLSKMSFSLIDMEDQINIVKQLGKIELIIEMKTKQIQEYDQLIKSRFVEMFGDPITNNKGWDVKDLNEITDVRDGTHDSPKYVDIGYPFVTSKNLVNGNIDFSTCQLISKDDLEKINQRSFVDDGDILMPMIGTIGGAIIVKKDRDFAIKNVALIKFNKENSIVDRKFILNVLNSDSMNEFFNSIKKGGTQNFISLGLIRKIPTIIPPLKLQNEFALFVEQVDKLKFAVQKSLDETQTLFDSLMQKYFG
jgi:type I restriction enzyme S subunit